MNVKISTFLTANSPKKCEFSEVAELVRVCKKISLAKAYFEIVY